VVGNPYASPLDFQSLYNSNSTLIEEQFYIWQAALGTTTGGYVLVKPTTDGSYEYIPNDNASANPPSAANRLIHSGQGFLVMPKGFNASSTASGTLQLQEAHKAGGTPRAGVLRQMDAPPAKLYVNVYTEWMGEKTLLDGVLAQYDARYSTGEGDVEKATNMSENLAIQKEAKTLIVSSSVIPRPGDTLRLRLWNTTSKTYQLDVRSAAFAATGLQAVLLDRFLQKETLLNGNDAVTSYSFQVTGDAASRDPLRFVIHFRASVAQSPLPLVVTTLSATEKRGGVEVEWKVADERGIATYAVERSANGRVYEALGSLPARAAAGEQTYRYLDAQPVPENWYRIKMTGQAGEVKYSAVVKVALQQSGAEGYSLYPNPLVSGPLSLQLQNKEKGRYTLTLYAATGQRVWQGTVQHSGGTAVYPLALHKTPAQGTYSLQITNKEAKTYNIPLQILK
jgi:hypothetical protein